MDWVEACKGIPVKDGKPVEERQWEIIRALVWCAQQAAENPNSYRTEIDPVRPIRFARSPPPPFIQADNWAWGCIHTFLDTPARGTPLKVPVALYDETTDKGFLAALSLEVLHPGGVGQLHHPADAFALSALSSCNAGRFCFSPDTFSSTARRGNRGDSGDSYLVGFVSTSRSTGGWHGLPHQTAKRCPDLKPDASPGSRPGRILDRALRTFPMKTF
jgi:hypothetical protein